MAGSFGELAAEWAKGSGADLTKVGLLLSKLKLEMSEQGLLIPSPEEAAELPAASLQNAREVLEVGALHSVRLENVPAFERYISLLSTYYSEPVSSLLPPSPNQNSLLALSLLRLLSQNRIADFHTALETLPTSSAESKEVEWVINLERSLMEGSYSRVFSLCRPSSAASFPPPEFSFFIRTLVGTVRTEIASCHEMAYESLETRDAGTMLFFNGPSEVLTFAKERNWYIDPKTSTIHFPTSPLHPSNITSSSKAAASNGIPGKLVAGGLREDKELSKEKVVIATLGYAKELESIV